ncbi:MAG: hypothetical protein ACR2OO_08605 [Thermomicrobiales bacterium]
MKPGPMLTIAFRDLLKFLRDPTRIVATLVFPIIFVAVLGGSLEKNLGAAAGYNFLFFAFTGDYARDRGRTAATPVQRRRLDRAGGGLARWPTDTGSGLPPGSATAPKSRPPTTASGWSGRLPASAWAFRTRPRLSRARRR